jgi:hypothetical protein
MKEKMVTGNCSEKLVGIITGKVGLSCKESFEKLKPLTFEKICKFSISFGKKNFRKVKEKFSKSYKKIIEKF